MSNVKCISMCTRMIFEKKSWPKMQKLANWAQYYVFVSFISSDFANDKTGMMISSIIHSSSRFDREQPSDDEEKKIEYQLRGAITVFFTIGPLCFGDTHN